MKFGLDPAHYACRTFPLDDMLPWDHIRSGVTKEFLKREYQRSQAAEITENCRVACDHCGIGCRDGGTASFGKPEEAAAAPARERSAPGRVRQAAHPEMTARIRMRYARTGRVRFLSHLDFMTLVHRAAVRAGIPLAWSQGFNPHPKIAFGPALPVGMESETEYLDLETDPFADLLQTTKDLNAVLPEGVRIDEAGVIPKKAPSLSGVIGRYRYRVAVPEKYQDRLEARVQEFLSRASVPVSREGKRREIRPCIEAIEPAVPADGSLIITLVDHGEIKPRIRDVIGQLFGVGQEESVLFPVRRTGLFYREGDRWKDPLDVA